MNRPPATDRWRIRVGRDCVRSGTCTALAPQHFRVDADHRTRATEGPVPPDPAVLTAAAACPAEAITVTDVTTGSPPPVDALIRHDTASSAEEDEHVRHHRLGGLRP